MRPEPKVSTKGMIKYRLVFHPGDETAEAYYKLIR